MDKGADDWEGAIAGVFQHELTPSTTMVVEYLWKKWNLTKEQINTVLIESLGKWFTTMAFTDFLIEKGADDWNGALGAAVDLYSKTQVPAYWDWIKQFVQHGADMKTILQSRTRIPRDMLDDLMDLCN